MSKQMQLILKEDVEKLGDAGEVVDVKPGYGRNYLIPQGKAVIASPGALRQLEKMRESAERRAELTVETAREMAERLETTTVTLAVPVGEDDKIHGSITNVDVAERLAERGMEIDRRKITLDQEINTLGQYTATVSLMAEMKAQVKVWVVEQEEE